MNDRELRRYEMFGRVATFCHDNIADFALDSVLRGSIVTLTGIIADLEKARARQQRDGTTSKAVLMDALRIDVKNIIRTARALDPKVPGLSDKFPSPKSSSDADWLTAADAILDKLLVTPQDADADRVEKAQLVQTFAARELPADFVLQLQAARDAVARVQDDIEANENDGVSSTAAVGRLLRAGMEEVDHLDAIMHNKYTRNPDKLRAWKSASHTERVPHHTKAPAPVPALAAE